MAPKSTQSMRLIISTYRLIGISCLRRTRILGGFSKRLRENLAGDGGRRVTAFFGRLNQHGDCELRLVVRCESDKPRALQALRLAVDHRVVLCCARLARDAQSLYRCGSCRATLDSAEHCLSHKLDLLWFRAQMRANIRLALMDDLAIGGLD